jgi:two-component system, NarL family, sensor histidine kinase DegS
MNPQLATGNALASVSNLREDLAASISSHDELAAELEPRGRGKTTLRQDPAVPVALMPSSDQERHLMACEMHDGVAQLLAVAAMHFESFHRLRGRQPETAATAFDAGLAALQLAHAETRRLISTLSLPANSELEVETAIAHFIRHFERPDAVKIEFHSDAVYEQMPPVLANAVLRIVQEGLINACKHCQGKLLRVELKQDHQCIRIEIEDDGVGFDPEKVGAAHFGLKGIRERARWVGGRTAVDSAPGRGTRILVELPLMYNLS